jgi:hypothetical protein
VTGEAAGCELSEKISGALDISRQASVKELELFINPAADAIGYVSTLGDDGTGGPRCLVDFDNQVELQMESTIEQGNLALEVGVIIFSEGIIMVKKEGVEVVKDLPNGSEEIGLSYLTVGCRIQEMIGIGSCNIGDRFEDDGPKILVGRDDNKPVGVLQDLEEVLLVGQ